MRKYYHILVTSLYYPAILGYLFYCVVNELTSEKFTVDSVFLIVAYIGIVAAFSVDFLYSYASHKYYSVRFFIADLVIVTLLFLASRTLIKGIGENSDLWLFFISYSLIHVIFAIWDLVLINRRDRKVALIAYDFFGLVISLIGLFLFRDSFIAAIVILWLCTIAYLLVGWKTIFRMIET